MQPEVRWTERKAFNHRAAQVWDIVVDEDFARFGPVYAGPQVIPGVDSYSGWQVKDISMFQLSILTHVDEGNASFWQYLP